MLCLDYRFNFLRNGSENFLDFFIKWAKTVFTFLVGGSTKNVIIK